MKSYVVSHLNNNESLVMEAKKHWFSLLPAVLELFAALVVIGMAGGIASLFDSIPMAPKIVRIFLFIVSLVLVYTAIQNYFIFFSTELGFTDKRVIGKVGFFRVRSLLTPLNKINNVSGFTGFFGRFLNYGSIQIYSSSGQFVYDYVVAHDEFLVGLMDQIDIYEKELQGSERQGGEPQGPRRRVDAEPPQRDPDRLDKAVIDFDRDAPLAKSKALPRWKGEPRVLLRNPGPDKEAAKEPEPSKGLCPFCKTPYQATPEMEGRQIQCKACKKQFVVRTIASA